MKIVDVKFDVEMILVRKNVSAEDIGILLLRTNLMTLMILIYLKISQMMKDI